jgi:TATA-box binding
MILGNLFLASVLWCFHQPAQASAVAPVTAPLTLTDGQSTLNYLSTSFDAAGATENGYLLHDWSTVNQQFVDVQQLARIGETLGQEIGIPNAKVTTRVDANEVYYQMDANWTNQTKLRIVLTSFAASQSAGATGGAPMVGGSTVLVISASSTSLDRTPLAKQYQQMEQAVANVNATPQMSACLEGYRDDKIVGVQASNLAQLALQAVNATPIEGMNTSLETSDSGYSPQGLTYILTNNKRMNVQVAIHDDTYDKRTNVLVGTPIITTTY